MITTLKIIELNKIKMKKAVFAGLVILLLTILNSCQPEEPENIIFEETLELTELGKDPNLAKLLSDFTGKPLNGRTESSEMPFGTLDYSNIVIRIANDDQPKPNYTIGLTPPDSVKNTREYLVLIGEEDGYWGYIVQYQADKQYFNTLINLDKLTGYARILDLRRNTIAVNRIENGTDIGSANTAKDGRSELSLINCTCIWGRTNVDNIHADGGSSADIDRTRIVCDCEEVGTIRDNEDGGTGGRTFLPGEPIGDNPFDGGGTGGSSGGSGRTPSDGIEEPEDQIGTISFEIPQTFVEIFEDEEFMEFMDETDCNLAWDFLNNQNYVKGSILQRAYAIFNGIAKNVALLTLNDVCDYSDEEKDQMLELFQGFLDIAGFVPGVGEFADGANAVIYLAQGDQLNAALSGVSIVFPLGGDLGAKGLRVVIKVLRKTPGGDILIKTAKEANFTQAKNLIDAFNRVGKDYINRLVDDMIDNPDILRKILDDPDLVDAWKVINNLPANSQKITGELSTVLQKINLAKNGDVSARAEIAFAKFMSSNGKKVHFNTPPNNATSMADFLIDGKMVDVKLASGIGANLASNIAKGVKQVGDNGIVQVIRNSNSTNTLSEFKDFIKNFSPSNNTVNIEVIDQSDIINFWNF